MTSTIQPKATIATFKLHSHGSGVAQTIQPDGSNHLIQVDAAPAFGGADAAPSPIAYALSALISCSQVTSQLVARDLGIQLHRFEFDLSAELDTAILVKGVQEGNPNFEAITINAIVDTDASDAAFETLKLETERRCPIYQLFLRSGIVITNHWLQRSTS